MLPQSESSFPPITSSSCGELLHPGHHDLFWPKRACVRAHFAHKSSVHASCEGGRPVPWRSRVVSESWKSALPEPSCHAGFTTCESPGAIAIAPPVETRCTPLLVVRRIGRGERCGFFQCRNPRRRRYPSNRGKRRRLSKRGSVLSQTSHASRSRIDWSSASNASSFSDSPVYTSAER